MTNPANVVVMYGYVATEPKGNVTQSGAVRCSFRLAVGKGRKGTDGRELADFFTVVTWRDTAKFCQNYVRKGRLVSICGQLTTYAYTAQDNTNRTEYQIEADSVRFISTGNNRQAAEAAPPSDEPNDYMAYYDSGVPY